jgi:hypothetical protein
MRRAEVADEQTSLTAANELAVRRALEAAGVEFIDFRVPADLLLPPPKKPPPRRSTKRAAA